ncbi:hypothetical protein PspLS_05241 [Pyricularia sp. CBS 133598]|nr:hypothetical protein PspLS_05241 [Pyricularia sp. CBS 133598]
MSTDISGVRYLPAEHYDRAGNPGPTPRNSRKDSSFNPPPPSSDRYYGQTVAARPPVLIRPNPPVQQRIRTSHKRDSTDETNNLSSHRLYVPPDKPLPSSRRRSTNEQRRSSRSSPTRNRSTTKRLYHQIVINNFNEHSNSDSSDYGSDSYHSSEDERDQFYPKRHRYPPPSSKPRRNSPDSSSPSVVLRTPRPHPPPPYVSQRPPPPPGPPPWLPSTINFDIACMKGDIANLDLRQKMGEEREKYNRDLAYRLKILHEQNQMIRDLEGDLRMMREREEKMQYELNKAVGDEIVDNEKEPINSSGRVEVEHVAGEMAGSEHGGATNMGWEADTMFDKRMTEAIAFKVQQSADDLVESIRERLLKEFGGSMQNDMSSRVTADRPTTDVTHRGDKGETREAKGDEESTRDTAVGSPQPLVMSPLPLSSRSPSIPSPDPFSIPPGSRQGSYHRQRSFETVRSWMEQPFSVPEVPGKYDADHNNGMRSTTSPAERAQDSISSASLSSTSPRSNNTEPAWAESHNRWRAHRMASEIAWRRDLAIAREELIEPILDFVVAVVVGDQNRRQRRASPGADPGGRRSGFGGTAAADGAAGETGAVVVSARPTAARGDVIRRTNGADHRLAVAELPGVPAVAEAETEAEVEPIDVWEDALEHLEKTSYVIESVEKEIEGGSDVARAYFYFKDGDENRVSFGIIWATLLSQLLEPSSVPLSTCLVETYNKPLIGVSGLLGVDYLDLFKAQVGLFRVVYLIIDGLDMYRDAAREKKWRDMRDALQGLPPNVRILYTSRDTEIIQEPEPILRLEIKPQKQEIQAYVEKRINDEDIKSPLKFPEIRDLVLKEVISMALCSGMFLLARLHMDNLCEQQTVADIKLALKELPDRAFEVFDKSAMRIAQTIKLEEDNFGTCVAKHILTWVMYAKEELTIEQIRDSYAVQRSRGQNYQEYRPVEARLLRSCIGLVVTDPDRKTLGLVHKSVQSHLQKKDYNIIPECPDLEMGKVCLMYLLADAGDQGGENPLRGYAARHWWSHINCEDGQHIDLEVSSMMLELLKDNKRLEVCFAAMMIGLEDGMFSGMTGLHAAVHFDLAPKWVERLLDADCGIDVDARCADGQTALHWAVRYGNCTLLKLLLSKAASANMCDKAGETPLHKALMGATVENKPMDLVTARTRTVGHDEAVVRALVDGKALLQLPNRQTGLSALSTAIKYGPTRLAKVMMEGQHDVDAEVFEQGWTSLRLVFYHGQHLIQQLGSGDESGKQLQKASWNHGRILIKLLLDRGVDLNRPSKVDGWTPLVHAAKTGDLFKMQQLLVRKDRPAKVTICDRDGISPLCWAISYKHVSAVQLLIEHGAGVNEIYADGSTPLITAVNGNDHETVWLLLRAGALLETQDAKGWSALLHAVSRKHKSIIWLLLTIKNPTGAAISQNMGWARCLQEAFEHAVDSDDLLSTAWLLCEHGASPNTADKVGMTPLHRAAKQGRLAAVRLLVDRGATIDGKDAQGCTPLHHAVRQKRDDVVVYLVTAAAGPAQLNASDEKGETAVSLATQKRSRPAVLRALLFHGAACNTYNKFGLTAVHYAAGLGNWEHLRLMINQDGDACAADKDHMFAPLHHVVNGKGGGHVESLHLLVANGASLEARDKYGRTALMLAAQLGLKDMVLALLEMGANARAVNKERTAADYTDIPAIRKLFERTRNISSR